MPFDLSDLIQPAGEALTQAKVLVAKLEPAMDQLGPMLTRLEGVTMRLDPILSHADKLMVDGDSVRACLMFAVQAEGAKIRTVEGLADGDTLHILQQSFIDHHGLQCGFCTPGMIMAVAALLKDNPHPSDEEIYHGLEGNLCRCTGYINIVKAVKRSAGMMKS